MRARKRMSPARRVARWLARLLLMALVYNIGGGYFPFARTAELDEATAARVERRAEEMSADIDTADRAAILESSAAALDERLRMMALAQREIIITTYECHDGESTRDLLAMACRKAREGVRVRFLCDGIAGWMDVSTNALFQAAAQCPNVEIRFYNPPSLLRPWRNMGRMHDKYVIVDDMAYILGGRNMYDGFLGEYPTRRHRSQDREALVYNAAWGREDSRESSLFQLRDYFESVWSGKYTVPFSPAAMAPERRDALLEELDARCEGLMAERGELFEPYDYEGATLETRGIWLVSNPTTIYAKKPEVFATLCALIDRAESDVVWHSPYAVLDKRMARALTEAAGRVSVTLMVNDPQNGANVVAGSDYLYHRDGVLATGVELLEYAGGISYHGKSLTIDDSLSVIGSYNLDPRSTYVDTELMLVIRGEAVNGQLRSHMSALHGSCRRVAEGEEAVVPEGLDIAPMPLWKSAAMRLLGAILQLVRNLI